eukprot:289048-Rhodomonas_salina.2
MSAAQVRARPSLRALFCLDPAPAPPSVHGGGAPVGGSARDVACGAAQGPAGRQGGLHGQGGEGKGGCGRLPRADPLSLIHI